MHSFWLLDNKIFQSKLVGCVILRTTRLLAWLLSKQASLFVHTVDINYISMFGRWSANDKQRNSIRVHGVYVGLMNTKYIYFFYNYNSKSANGSQISGFAEVMLMNDCLHVWPLDGGNAP